jgi:hypothetical protein
MGGWRRGLTGMTSIVAVTSATFLVLWPQPGWAHQAESQRTTGSAAAVVPSVSCCTVTVNGPAVSMKVTSPGVTVKKTFSGVVGQRISAVITNVVTSDDGCETLYLLDPSGATVISGFGCGNGNPVSLGPITLATTGTYTLRYEIDTVATGTAKLMVSS